MTLASAELRGRGPGVLIANKRIVADKQENCEDCGGT